MERELRSPQEGKGHLEPQGAELNQRQFDEKTSVALIKTSLSVTVQGAQPPKKPSTG